MKKNILLIGLFLISINIIAQDANKTIADLQKNTNAIVTINNNSGIAEFVRFPVNNALHLDGIQVEEKVFSFLEMYKGIFNIDLVPESFVVENSKIDNYGLKHVTLKQVYHGVPIYDGQLKFHFNIANELTAINGNYIPKIKLNPEATLSEVEANSLAMEAINKQNLNHSGTPLFINKNTLFVFQKGLAQGQFTTRHLAYEVEIRNDLDVREFLFVDAHSGEVIEQFTGMAHALERIVYEENTNTSSIVWQEGDAFPGSLSIWQQNEVVASEHMYNFFNNAFGYASYDGADITMRTINNNPNISCPNANWNGSTANYCDGTASDDVIAHEWGHAYTSYTSGLIYAWQSGAINESYSDIWGETVDLLNNYEDTGENNAVRSTGCNGNRWKIGEDATAFGSSIRDMWNPPCKGDPGKVTDSNYWCSEGDSGGVHINSGIPNHAYALLVDGGDYNGQTVVGLGFTKAAHIFWRTQSEYLTSTSNFMSLADGLEAAGADLLGLNLEGLSTAAPTGLSGEIITAFDLEQLNKVLLAVELRVIPEACGFVTILAPLTAELCETATNNPVFFEDWESGMGSWTVEQLPVNTGTWESRDWVISNSLPSSRTGNAIFGTDPVNGNCTSDLENGIIRLLSPVITIPDFTDGTFEMAFNHYVSTETNWDGANIKYSVDGGDWTILPAFAFLENPYNSSINTASAGNDNPMEGQEAFTGSDGGSNSGSWGTSIIDLSAIGVLTNTTVQFQFEMGTDGCNGREGWYIDEIMIYNCDMPLSVAEYDVLNNSIVVYPNPSNGLFTLQKTQNIDLRTATIHDINGRVIRTLDLTNMYMQQEINITNLASGIYFMTVASLETKTVIKLVKE